MVSLLAGRNWRVWLLGALPALVSCGKVENSETAPTAPGASTAGTGAGGSALAGAAGSVAFAGSAGTPGAGGSAGTMGAAGGGQAPSTRPADVAGRWGMFVFADPVGVRLGQTGESLWGEGCAEGAPLLSEPPASLECGPVFGLAHADGARFGFMFKTYTYLADTRISADGQRMTGQFHGINDVSWPTAWLRVPDDQAWLPPDPNPGPDPWRGSYSLRLEEATDDAREYDVMTPYELTYADQGIASSLGSFWHSELARVDAVRIEVGPVPTTAPELAVAMTLQGDHANISTLRATTGSGHRYIFRASRR